MSGLRLDPAFDAEEFKQLFWQKKPVLLPKLVENFADALSAEELAGLACEELVESRLITEFEKGNYLLRNGPFTEPDFTQLPSSNWTILVQAVDQWVDEIADLKRLFEFIPSWRIDDIMVSFAATGGSVGPHFDYYDVFLLQGAGKRNWKVGQRCDSNTKLLANSELSLLTNFAATMEFNLEAGDALYIPPRYAHWGIAKSDSLCYSIGFRAPSMAEMIEGFSDFIIKSQDPAQRFEDSEIHADQRSGEIRTSQLNSSFQRLFREFSDRDTFIAWFGCYVSQPKYPELIEPIENPFSSVELVSLLDTGVILRKNPSSRFAFIESTANSSVSMFVDGAMTTFPIEKSGAVAWLCESKHFELDGSAKFLADAEIAELLRQLLNQGSLLTSE